MENEYIIDRFEGEFAICETIGLKFINIRINELPKNIKEGSILIMDQNTGQYYVKDDYEQKIRLGGIKEKMNRLWK